MQCSGDSAIIVVEGCLETNQHIVVNFVVAWPIGESYRFDQKDLHIIFRLEIMTYVQTPTIRSAVIHGALRLHLTSHAASGNKYHRRDLLKNKAKPPLVVTGAPSL